MSQKKNFSNLTPAMCYVAAMACVVWIPGTVVGQDSQAWEPPSAPQQHIPSTLSIPIPNPSANNNASATGTFPNAHSDWPETGVQEFGGEQVRQANLEFDVPDVSEADHPMGFLERVGNSAAGSLQGLLGQESGVGNQVANIQIGKVFGSLAIVLGIYFGFVWLTRRFGGKRNSGLPSEVVEVMGHIPFGPKKNLQLIRLGTKLLLLINGPEGTHPIGEITNPEEVEYLAGLCNPQPGRHHESIRRVVNRVQSTAQSVPDSLSELNNAVRALANAAGRKSSGNVFEA